jgi:histidine triad (HIT) family protein
MASIFTKIILGDIPAYKIAETEDFLAFLDMFPIREGHTLVIPKKEVDYIFNLDDDTHQRLWVFAKQIAHAVEAAVPCLRLGVAVLGLEVPHAHIHLIPLHSETDLNFKNPRLKLTAEEYEDILSRIKSHLPTSLG